MIHADYWLKLLNCAGVTGGTCYNWSIIFTPRRFPDSSPNHNPNPSSPVAVKYKRSKVKWLKVKFLALFALGIGKDNCVSVLLVCSLHGCVHYLRSKDKLSLQNFLIYSFLRSIVRLTVKTQNNGWNICTRCDTSELLERKCHPEQDGMQMLAIDRLIHLSKPGFTWYRTSSLFGEANQTANYIL